MSSVETCYFRVKLFYLSCPTCNSPTSSTYCSLSQFLTHTELCDRRHKLVLKSKYPIGCYNSSLYDVNWLPENNLTLTNQCAAILNVGQDGECLDVWRSSPPLKSPTVSRWKEHIFSSVLITWHPLLRQAHRRLIRPGCISPTSWDPVGVFPPDPEPLAAALCSRRCFFYGLVQGFYRGCLDLWATSGCCNETLAAKLLLSSHVVLPYITNKLWAPQM